MSSGRAASVDGPASPPCGTSSKPKVLVLTGPTAVGKTKISLALAERLNGEIISADSVQVYRDLDIGSDKVGRCRPPPSPLLPLLGRLPAGLHASSSSAGELKVPFPPAPD